MDDNYLGLCLKNRIVHPAVASFNVENEKTLRYIASEHVDDIKSPSNQLVDQEFAKSMPTCVVVEGFTSQKGMKSFLEKQGRNDQTDSENVHMAALAHMQGIPIILGEPNDHETKTHLEKNHEAEKVELFMSLSAMTIYYNLSWPEELKKDPECIKFIVDAYFPEPAKAKACLEWIQTQYGPKSDFFSPELFDDLSPAADYIYNKEDPKYTSPFYSLNMETILFREETILTRILEATEKYDHTLVAYGAAHYIRTRPELEKRFGAPTYRNYYSLPMVFSKLLPLCIANWLSPISAPIQRTMDEIVDALSY